MVAKLDQSRVLVTKLHQNRLTLKGRSAGQRHRVRQTDRQTNSAENNGPSGLQSGQQTDTLTDRVKSVTIVRIYVRSSTMRPNKMQEFLTTVSDQCRRSCRVQTVRCHSSVVSCNCCRCLHCSRCYGCCRCSFCLTVELQLYWDVTLPLCSDDGPTISVTVITKSFVISH